MVAGMNQQRRVAALETQTRSLKLMNIPLICAHLGETKDDAVARHVAEHGPLPDDEGNAEQVNAIVLVPVAPAQRAAA
jgi:hypothetical protein